MVEVSNNFIQECEANVGTYKFGKIKVNYIDDNPLNYEQGAYSSSNGAKIDAEQSIRYNKLVECEPNFKYKIELGNSTTKMKIVTYNANQEFIAVHDNLIQGSELTTEATARYISVTIYSNDTLEGTAITLNGTIRNGEILGAELKGNTSQNGTPTPSSPVPVNNVTGEQIVRVCGKNLIEIERQTTTQSGLTFTINEDKSISVTGTFSSTVYFNLFNGKKAIKPSTIYTLSGAVSPSARLRIRLFNQSQTQLSEYYLSNKNGYIFTTPSNAYYYDLYIVMYAVNEGDTFYPQLKVGSSMTDYEPYQGKDYEINLGNIELNKIGDYQDFIRKGSGKNLYVGYDNMLEGFLPQSGAYPTTNPSAPNARYFTINLKKGESITTSGITNNATGRIRFIDKTTNQVLGSLNIGQNDYYITTASYGDGFKNGTITAKQDFIVGIMSISENEYGLEKFQIEQGSIATYYEPYGYKDKWYMEKNVDKFILDKANTASGKNYCNVNTTWDEQNEGYIHFQFPEIIVKYNDGDKIMIVDNRFPSVTIANRNLKAEQIFAHYTNGVVSITIETSRLNGITSSSSVTEKRNAFNTWLTSNPITMYYVMVNPTYTLIENEELIEQLEAVSHAETQEGITNIMTMGDLPAILDVMPDLTESIRGKQTTPIVGYNITGEDDLINFKITSKADSNGNILGATSQSQVDIEIFNENNAHNLENKQVYISTGLNETEGNYCKWQPFTITQTKDTQTKNHTTYTGYDDMMRGNEAYIDNVDYGEEGITLYDFTCNLAKEMGMALGNTMMTNGEFIVKGNNFTNNETKLVVLKNIAQMVGGFAMIDRDNLLRIVELSPEYAMTPIELTTNLYTEDFQNSAKFGEINEFAIGETNIETNAIVRSDDASIAKNGVKKIEILDNMFLGLLEDKEIAIEPLWDAFNGFSYYPFKTPYNGYPYIDLGDKINITDINSNVYSTLVLNNVFEYNGGYKGNIGAEALSITAAKYKTNNTLSKQFRKVGIDIDRVEGEITAEIAAREDTTEHLSQLSQTVSEINSTVSATTTTVSDLETRVQTNETSISQNADSITATVTRVQKTEDDVETLQTNTEDVVNQLVFGDDGLTISAKGSTSDDMKLNLTNDAIKFLYNNNAVLTINGSVIEFSNASFKKLDLGNYVWQAEDDDSLSLIYES